MSGGAGRVRRAAPWAVLTLLLAATAVAAAYPAALRIPRREPGRAAAVPQAMFSHRTHGAFACFNCHPATFPQAAVGFTHDDMNKGSFCGRCHDGQVAFAVLGAACARCHVAR